MLAETLARSEVVVSQFVLEVAFSVGFFLRSRAKIGRKHGECTFRDFFRLFLCDISLRRRDLFLSEVFR